MLTIQSIPIPNPLVVSQIVEGEAILVIPDKAKVKVLNEVGGFIWSQIDGVQDIASIVSTVCTEYDIDTQIAQTDALAFLEELFAKNLILLAQKE